MMDIKEVLPQSFTNSLIKKTSVSGIKNENMLDQQLEEELQKPIIRNLNERKAHSPFTNNA